MKRATDIRNPFGITFVFLIASACGVGAGDPSFLTAEAICEAWEASYGYLDSMDVAYRKYPLKVEGSADYDFSHIALYEQVDRQESGIKYRVDYSFGFGEGGCHQMNRLEQAFNGRANLKYMANGRSALVRSGLSGSSTDHRNELSRNLLLSTKTNQGQPIFLYNMETAMSAGLLKIGPYLEDVNGMSCHVIHLAEGSGLAYLIWVAHDYGMLPIKQYWRSPEMEVVTTVEAVASVETRQGTMFYPVSATLQYGYLREKATLTSKLEVSRFVPFALFDDSVFTVTIPHGTRVIDQAAGLSYLKGIDDPDNINPFHFEPLDPNEWESPQTAPVPLPPVEEGRPEAAPVRAASDRVPDPAADNARAVSKGLPVLAAISIALLGAFHAARKNERNRDD